MRIVYIIIFIFLTVYSCKKENNKVDIKIKKENYNPTEYFSFPTNIKKWKKYKEIAVNDSLKKVRGEFEDYKIEGYINQYNQKINWWNIVNKKNIQADNVRIEYRIIDNIEYVNQYINYDTIHGDDIKNSLFYLKEKLNNKTLRYKFYTPNKKIKVNASTTFFLSFFLNNKEIRKKNLKCIRNDNYYYVDVNYVNVNDNIIVKGLFEEGYEYDDGEMGLNEIYILDMYSHPS